MRLLNEVVKAGVLTLVSLLVVGVVLIVYYSLGISFMALFLFIVFLFLVRSVRFQIEFNHFD
jgi:hypothetical protein